MKKLCVVLALLILVIIPFTACTEYRNPENQNWQDKPYIIPAFQLNHLAWLPIEEGESLPDLLQNIDDWIENHPEVDIIDVDIVNNTEKTASLGSTTIPSGAVIIFKKK